MRRNKSKESKRATDKISESKSWFFEKMNRIDIPLIQVTKNQNKLKQKN